MYQTAPTKANVGSAMHGLVQFGSVIFGPRRFGDVICVGVGCGVWWGHICVTQTYARTFV
jgi:hypothetical protein